MCMSICQLVNWPNCLPQARREKEKKRGEEGKGGNGRKERTGKRKGGEKRDRKIPFFCI